MSFIVEFMDVISVSGVLLVAIIVMLLIGWAPLSTADSMKNATRHVQDKFSRSLHVVDDVRNAHIVDTPTQFKEASMSANAQFSPEYVNRVRARRKEAIGRRRILVGGLLAATIAVCALSFMVHFSIWFTLIPAALVMVVLGLGARQAFVARQWEAKVRELRETSERIVERRHSAITRSLQTSQDMEYRHGLSGEISDMKHDDDTQTIQFERVSEIPGTLPQDSVDSVDAVSDDTTQVDVVSREIVSVKQVSVAIPPTHDVRIPAHDDLVDQAIQQQDVDDTAVESVDLDSVIALRRR